MCGGRIIRATRLGSQAKESGVAPVGMIGQIEVSARFYGQSDAARRSDIQTNLAGRIATAHSLPVEFAAVG